MVILSYSLIIFFFFFFFFQAEDGIRDLTVTGVQTCALPISVIGQRDRDRPCWGRGCDDRDAPVPRDRKSTRLNSSHSQISYAVFCLKKKKTTHSSAAAGSQHHVDEPHTPAASPPSQSDHRPA